MRKSEAELRLLSRSGSFGDGGSGGGVTGTSTVIGSGGGSPGYVASSGSLEGGVTSFEGCLPSLTSTPRSVSNNLRFDCTFEKGVI